MIGTIVNNAQAYKLLLTRGHRGCMRLQIKASSTCHDLAYSHLQVVTTSKSSWILEVRIPTYTDQGIWNWCVLQHSIARWHWDPSSSPFTYCVLVLCSLGKEILWIAAGHLSVALSRREVRREAGSRRYEAKWKGLLSITLSNIYEHPR